MSTMLEGTSGQEQYLMTAGLAILVLVFLGLALFLALCENHFWRP